VALFGRTEGQSEQASKKEPEPETKRGEEAGERSFEEAPLPPISVPTVTGTVTGG